MNSGEYWLKRQTKLNTIMLIAAIIVLIVAFSVFFVMYSRSEKNVDLLFSDSLTSFEMGWQNQFGLSYDVSSLSMRDAPFDTENSLKLTKTVPNFEGKAAIFFRTNNLVVNVYLADECVYHIADSGEYENLSSFSSYCYIPLSEGDIGKTIMLEMYKTPASNGYCIDNFVFGSPENITYNAYSKDSALIVAAVLTIVAGIVFIWMGVLSIKTYEHYRGLLFFGIFAILIGMWFLSDTLWIYNTCRNISFIEHLSRIFLSACVPCFMMYIYDFFNIKRKELYITLTGAGFVLFVALLVLNLTDILSFGYTNFIQHIYIALCCVIILIEMISYLSKINGNKGESKVFNIGIMFFIFFVLFDLGRFYQGNEGNSSLFTRLGVFILTVTAVAATTTDVVDLLKLGIKAGKIGKIAYTDANTGLGNPAAFKSKFEELDRTKNNYSYIGIIQFDVNNLKVINDSLGHEAGDLLIKTAAEIIDNSFSTIGSCYRVGGDEFVTITTFNHAPLVCEEAILKFENAIDKFNENPNRPFDLRIAYGVAYYTNDSHQYQSLKEVHKLADERMYNKKKELKARYAKTPEEAVIR